MEHLFTIDHKHHGKGPILYAWHPSSKYIASTGSSRVVHIFDWRGKLIDQIIPPSSSQCISLEWEPAGRTLALLQGGGTHEVLLWDFDTREIEHVDLNIEPTFMKWSKRGNQLAIGTNKGDLLMYDKYAKQAWYAAAKHKKRISCGDWSDENNQFAFASDDRQISIITADGKTFGQVKVKSRPTNVKFGGNESGRENIVSVSMDRKTILLYNLDDPENALELAFQQRYGHIVVFKWFRDGYIMVGFSLGYLVVISTHMSEIGREQFCARFHKDNLRDIAYCPLKGAVATCGDNCIKLVGMKDWKDYETEDIDKSNGPLEKLVWTDDGNCVSVSTRNGSLLVYAVGHHSEPFRAGGASGTVLCRLLTHPLDAFSALTFSLIAALVLLFVTSRLLGVSVADALYLFFDHATL